MKILELFAGSRSFSNVAENLGYKTYSTDIVAFKKINQVSNIFNFDIEKMLLEFGKPNIIWASPPCTTFSVASVYRHWKQNKNTLTPKSKEAEIGIKIIKKTIEIIETLKPKYFYIENPRGILRKLNIINNKNFIKNTVWYCQYFDGVGINRAKPTDIWTNNINWIPKKQCKNNNKYCNHVRAPRGSKTGTQGLKNNYERSKIPNNLCKEILSVSIN